MSVCLPSPFTPSVCSHFTGLPVSRHRSHRLSVHTSQVCLSPVAVHTACLFTLHRFVCLPSPFTPSVCSHFTGLSVSHRRSHHLSVHTSQVCLSPVAVHTIYLFTLHMSLSPVAVHTICLFTLHRSVCLPSPFTPSVCSHFTGLSVSRRRSHRLSVHTSQVCLSPVAVHTVCLFTLHRSVCLPSPFTPPVCSHFTGLPVSRRRSHRLSVHTSQVCLSPVAVHTVCLFTLHRSVCLPLPFTPSVCSHFTCLSVSRRRSHRLSVHTSQVCLSPVAVHTVCLFTLHRFVCLPSPFTPPVCSHFTGLPVSRRRSHRLSVHTSQVCLSPVAVHTVCLFTLLFTGLSVSRRRSHHLSVHTSQVCLSPVAVHTVCLFTLHRSVCLPSPFTPSVCSHFTGLSVSRRRSHRLSVHTSQVCLSPVAVHTVCLFTLHRFVCLPSPFTPPVCSHFTGLPVSRCRSHHLSVHTSHVCLSPVAVHTVCLFTLHRSACLPSPFTPSVCSHFTGLSVSRRRSHRQWGPRFVHRRCECRRRRSSDQYESVGGRQRLVDEDAIISVGWSTKPGPSRSVMTTVRLHRSRVTNEWTRLDIPSFWVLVTHHRATVVMDRPTSPTYHSTATDVEQVWRRRVLSSCLGILIELCAQCSIVDYHYYCRLCFYRR